MSDESKGYLKGCLIGCGVAVLLAIIVPIVGGLMMIGPFRYAIDTREEIEERFGDESAFTPSVDGSIPADRLEAFLEVRNAIAKVSSKLEAASAQMRRMDEFDDQEEVSRTEVLGEAFKTTKAAFGIGPAMGELFHARNQALLEAEMNLGEYTYIYTMAYHQRLIEDEDWGELFDDSPVNRRVRRLLVEILGNQLAAIQGAGTDSEAADLLERQISALDDYDISVPYEEQGLPPSISRSIAPYRSRLDELFFPATAGLDLSKNKSHGGISIETE